MKCSSTNLKHRWTSINSEIEQSIFSAVSATIVWHVNSTKTIRSHVFFAFIQNEFDGWLQLR